MAMTMTAAMLMEKAESDQVDDQPHGAHPQNQLGVVDGLGLVEPLQALDRDGETERNLEDRIHKGSQDLSPGPTESVFAPRLWSHSHGNESNYKGSDVRKHVKAVSNKGHGVGDVSDDDLDEEEGGGEAEHADQPAFLPRELALPPACALPHLVAFLILFLSGRSPFSLLHMFTSLLFLWRACFLLAGSNVRAQSETGFDRFEALGQN